MDIVRSGQNDEITIHRSIIIGQLNVLCPDVVASVWKQRRDAMRHLINVLDSNLKYDLDQYCKEI